MGAFRMPPRHNGPIFGGGTTNEGTIFTMGFAQSLKPWQYHAFVLAVFNWHGPRVLDLYPLEEYKMHGDSAPFVAFSDIVGDILFSCPLRAYAQNQVKHNREVFYWLLGQTPPLDPPCEIMYGMPVTPSELGALGAYHGLTIPYFEGNSNTGGDPRCL